MDELTTMWRSIPPATPEQLAGARQRLLDGMRAPRRRAITGPQLVAAAVVAAAAATTVVLQAGSPVYAVARSADGTITVTVRELRDPEGLQAELGAAGVKADVTFLDPGERCRTPRFTGADPSYGGPPVSQEELRWGAEHWRSSRAVRTEPGRGFVIRPELVREGETLVMEFSEHPRAGVKWEMGAWLAAAGSPVTPCVPVRSTS
ncbi:hypothetical protein [Nonomuraea sp. KM90]|uniref:hypothetical protein n=1 Tax=Nonomuraea sp. KM90 TaxID=3457428 RepID=UPI003FCDE7FC